MQVFDFVLALYVHAIPDCCQITQHAPICFSVQVLGTWR